MGNDAQTRRSTILDVARAAGVSTATVSRVLNGGAASPRARRAVEEAAARLEYRRNDLARGLVTGQTGVVGVLIPDISGPLYAQMARGIEDVLSPLGMHYLMATDNRDPGQERAAIELLLARQVDALILIGSLTEPATLQRQLGNGTRAVLMQRESDDAAAGFGTVQLDNGAGVRAALEHLIERGHRHIAHVCGVRRDAAERRRQYERVMREHCLEPGPVLVSDSTEQGGVCAGSELLTHPHVSAVLCANDRVAAGLYRTVKAAGLRLPQDLSVIGFDDLPWSEFLDPPLTTIRQPAREMGRAAADLVVAMLRGGAPEHVPMPAQLIERASVMDRRPGRGWTTTASGPTP